MTAIRPLVAFVALSSLSGCASAVTSLDRMADQVDARSTCHTSTGEWVGGPSCTISWSGATTTTTTKTVVTTVTPPASPPPADD